MLEKTSMHSWDIKSDKQASNRMYKTRHTLEGKITMFQLAYFGHVVSSSLEKAVLLGMSPHSYVIQLEIFNSSNKVNLLKIIVP